MCLSFAVVKLSRRLHRRAASFLNFVDRRWRCITHAYIVNPSYGFYDEILGTGIDSERVKRMYLLRDPIFHIHGEMACTLWHPIDAAAEVQSRPKRVVLRRHTAGYTRDTRRACSASHYLGSLYNSASSSGLPSRKKTYGCSEGEARARCHELSHLDEGGAVRRDEDPVFGARWGLVGDFLA